MVTDGPETWLQAKVSGEGPPSGSLPLPERVTVAPAVTVWSGPAEAVGGMLPPPGGMVKLALPMSKKTLPTASTLRRAVLVGELGTSTDCEPSLGVLARSTVGKVCPPSVDKTMRTLAAPTG